MVESNELKTAFAIAFFQPRVNSKVLRLMSEFVSQQEIVKTKLLLSPQHAIRVFPEVREKSEQPFIKDSWFQWLEKNYPNEVKTYLQNNAISMFNKLVENKDYTSIEHFRLHYQIDPFDVLISKEEKSCPWVETSSFRYLDEKMHDKVKNYISTHQDTVIDRFQLPALAAANQFEKIDFYRESYGMDPFVALKKDTKQWPNSPLFQYVESRDLEKLKNYIKQDGQLLVRFQIANLGLSKDFKSLENLTKYDIDLFPILMDTQLNSTIVPWVSTPLFKYLNSKFPSRVTDSLKANFDKLVTRFMGNYIGDTDLVSLKLISEYGVISVAHTIDSIVKNAKKNDHGRIEGDFSSLPLFKLLEEIQFIQVNTYFTKQMTSETCRILTGTNVAACAYLANMYNVDPYKLFKKLSNEEDRQALQGYYSHRCKTVLDFIFSQTYPKVQKRYADSIIVKGIFQPTWNGKKIKVSAELNTIIQKLQNAIFKPNSAAHLYGEVVREMAYALVKSNTNERDDNEHQIYLALEKILDDQSPLSRYVKREFEIKRDCLPFLTGLKFPGSVLNNASKNKLFDRKLLGQVLRFVGDFGIKDDMDVKREQELKDQHEERVEQKRP